MSRFENPLDKKNLPRFESESVNLVKDNIRFAKKIHDKPVKQGGRYDKKIFGATTINLNHYINQRIWPRSIYVTDKLLRLNALAELKMLEKYLKKKRKIGFDNWWLIILIMCGIGGVILVIIFLLPKIMGAL